MRRATRESILTMGAEILVRRLQLRLMAVTRPPRQQLSGGCDKADKAATSACSSGGL